MGAGSGGEKSKAETSGREPAKARPGRQPMKYQSVARPSAASASSQGQIDTRALSRPLFGASTFAGKGADAVCAAMSPANETGSARLGVGSPKLNDAEGVVDACETAGAGATVFVRAVATRGAAAAADGAGWRVSAEAEAEVAVSVAGAGSSAAGASARFVTVPLSEKLRSCAGPTASAELVVGVIATGAFVAGVASWAIAGAAKPVASATAAENTRNLSVILTRSVAPETAAPYTAATPPPLPLISMYFKHMVDERQATSDEIRAETR